LIEIQGDVKLQRDGWPEAHPVGIGTMIRFDDLLHVTDRANILCGDLTPQHISGLDQSSPCPRGAGWLMQDGAKYKVGIASVDDIPYVEHPRHTVLLNRQPVLRWHDTGASSYTVIMMQGGKGIWSQKDVVGTELPYPSDELQPGLDYGVLVIDNDTGKRSESDPEPGLGFRLVTLAERTEIEAKQAKIDELEFPNQAMHDFTLAVHYASWQDNNGWGLWSEAQLLLESLPPTENAPAIYLWQGDISQKIRLRPQAETAYQLALEQANTLGDQETQAAAHVGLWQTTGDESHCQPAIALYTQLGDQQQADWVKQNCE
jgi:hypothetical protein